MIELRKVDICESFEEMKALISSGSSEDGSDLKSSDKRSKFFSDFNSSFIFIELRIHFLVSASVSESLIKISTSCSTLIISCSLGSFLVVET